MDTPVWRISTLAANGVDKNALSGRNPSRTIHVPKELQRSTYTREIVALLDEIKVNTGCNAIAFYSPAGTSKFDIFGPSSGVEHAMKQLNTWITNSSGKAKGASSWAKIGVFDVNEWYDGEVNAMEMERKQRFKGAVPEPVEGEPTLYKATVAWPSDLLYFKYTPRDPFGPKLEGLDPIRLRNEVYITLLNSRSSPWEVEIRGADLDKLEAAEKEYRSQIDKIRTDYFSVPHEVTMILDVVKGADVAFRKADPWWPHSASTMVPYLRRSGVKEGYEYFRETRVSPIKVAQLRSSIQEAFAKIQHRKGTYDFTIRLGCIAISPGQVGGSLVGKVFEIDAFSKTLDTSNKVDVKKWLVNDQLGDRLLSRLMKAHDFLVPHRDSFGRGPQSLEETRPLFRGSWIFRNPEPAKNKQFIVVQILWTLDEDGTYEKMKPKYYQLAQANPKDYMEISLLELDESRAWRFSLESMSSLSSKIVPPILAQFADRVQMAPDYDPSSKDIFARWERLDSISKLLVGGRLDKTYPFDVRDTSYSVEAMAMWYPGKAHTCWGLAIRRHDWEAELAKLPGLPEGKGADWGDTMTTFFPDENPSHTGIGLLLSKMMQLSELTRLTSTEQGGVAI